VRELPTIPYDLDDHLLAGTRGDGRPRVRVYPWQGVAVVIGRGGKQHLELDTAAIAADGTTLYRRPGGGCAVVLDPGNVIVSVVLPLPGLSGIKSAFAAISTWLAGHLALLEVPGVQQLGVSDLAIGDRKIGGSCVFRTRDLLYYSTTLLVDPDLDLVDRYLPHPPREPEYRQGRGHRQFMGRLADHSPWTSPSQLAPVLEEGLKFSLAPLSNSLILP
jgi:lipoate-protein ligase A